MKIYYFKDPESNVVISSRYDDVWTGYYPATAAEFMQYNREQFKKLLVDSDVDHFGGRPTVYAIERSRARSGLSCSASLYIVVQSKMVRITSMYAALSGKLADEGAFRFQCCGFNYGDTIREKIRYACNIEVNVERL